jgi:hypothetical protein
MHENLKNDFSWGKAWFSLVSLRLCARNRGFGVRPPESGMKYMLNVSERKEAGGNC